MCRQRLKNPPMTIDDYVSCLAHQGLDTTAAFFAANAAVL
jgi:hypothetical protein